MNKTTHDAPAPHPPVTYLREFVVLLAHACVLHGLLEFVGGNTTVLFVIGWGGDVNKKLLLP